MPIRPDELPSLLRESRAEAGTPEMRDLWHNGWSLLAIVGLLAAEWVATTTCGIGVMTMTQDTKDTKDTKACRLMCFVCFVVPSC